MKKLLANLNKAACKQHYKEISKNVKKEIKVQKSLILEEIIREMEVTFQNNSNPNLICQRSHG